MVYTLTVRGARGTHGDGWFTRADPAGSPWHGCATPSTLSSRREPLVSPIPMAKARLHRPRSTSRIFGSLLLVAAAGLGAVSAVPASAHPGATRAATRFDSIVPAPASATPGGSPYEITAATGIRVTAGPAVRGHATATAGKSAAAKKHKKRGAAAQEAEQIGTYLAGLLRPSTGFPLPVTDAPGADGIRLELAPDETGLGTEGYRLTSNAQAVTITAAAPGGLFHGVQTLRQLLPAAVELSTAQPGPWEVAGGTIEDSPRYAYRGAMLDVSRHFFSVDQVKRYIDELALYKINELHLHLSDDQGWRIAIDSWPNLATYGGSTEVGGGPGGHYTKDQYTELVRYAASRYWK